MGTASQVVSLICRGTEFIAAIIVVAIVGEYLAYFTDAHAHADSKMVYGIAIGGISLLASMVLFPPLKYSFYAFPLDCVLFICWMVVFGLFINLSDGGNCTSTWYYHNWGYFWGHYYLTIPNSQVTESLVGTAACGKWRAVIAWSWIGGMAWLTNTCLGIYVCYKMRYDKSFVIEVNVVEERDEVGWHAKVRRLGQAIGYNPGNKVENVDERTDVISPSTSPYEPTSERI